MVVDLLVVVATTCGETNSHESTTATYWAVGRLPTMYPIRYYSVVAAAYPDIFEFNMEWLSKFNVLIFTYEVLILTVICGLTSHNDH